METWTRDDGRYFVMDLTRDMFGPVVMVAHGGRTPPQRRNRHEGL